MTTQTIKPSIWAFANPTRFNAFANKAIPVLAVITFLLITIGLWMSFNAPQDYQQGYTVLIMFIHVPAAWLAMMCYSVMCVSAIGTIVWRHPLADVSLRSAAPLGAMFTILALATGSLWGKPMWGTWWEWDARMTSVLVLLIIYLGLIALSKAFDEPSEAAMPLAVMTLTGAPFLYPLLVMALAYMAIFFTLHMMSMRNEILARRIRTMKMQAARKTSNKGPA